MFFKLCLFPLGTQFPFPLNSVLNVLVRMNNIIVLGGDDVVEPRIKNKG
jgi:hypothetical protein